MSSVWNFWPQIADLFLHVSHSSSRSEWEAAVFAGYRKFIKTLSQSSALSFVCFLVNLKQVFLFFFCSTKVFSFAWKPCILSWSCISTPLCSKLQYFSAEDSWVSSLLNCSVCTLLSWLIFKQYWSKQMVVCFLVCLRSTLFSTTCSPDVPSC